MRNSLNLKKKMVNSIFKSNNQIKTYYLVGNTSTLSVIIQWNRILIWQLIILSRLNCLYSVSSGLLFVFFSYKKLLICILRAHKLCCLLLLFSFLRGNEMQFNTQIHILSLFIGLNAVIHFFGSTSTVEYCFLIGNNLQSERNITLI